MSERPRCRKQEKGTMNMVCNIVPTWNLSFVLSNPF